MTVKVFTGVPQVIGYQGNPATSFLITVPYRVCCSDGGEDNGPRAMDLSMDLVLSPGATPVDTQTQAYNQVIAGCDNFGWPRPSKMDVYALVPTVVAQLLPTVPSMA